MLSINGLQITPTYFPDHTSQVWKLPEQIFNLTEPTITWDFTHEGELIHLAQLKALLERSKCRKVHLDLPYLPYGRQDKDIDNNATFAFRAFAKILNNLAFDSITILDPHSNVFNLLKNAVARYPHEELKKVVDLVKPDFICYPDCGAAKKYTAIYPYSNFFTATKIRDQQTGQLSKPELVDPPDLKGKRVLIVDDICDGGYTFIQLASVLYHRPVYAEPIFLFTTHGIFSKGYKPFVQSMINGIYTSKGQVVPMIDTIGYKTI